MTDDDDKKSADCTNDFLQSMDDIAILDDVGKKTRRRHRRLASHVLPEMVIQRALGATLLRRLKTDKGRPVVVSVSAPGADWCKPLSRPIRNWNAKVIVRDGSVRMENATNGSSDVNDALADGNHVFGISHAPERLLPATLTLVADARVEAKIPDGKMIRSLISRCVGRPPKVVPDDVAAGLSFDDIVSAFRPRATPAQVVAALAAASAARCRVSVTDATPPLDKLPGYSEDLRQWALDLTNDVAAWRAGGRPFKEISSSAILTGPPGCGKSLFARSLATTLKVPTVLASVSSWFGNSAGYLDSVIKAADADFSAARALARSGSGCLLFLDEVDAIPNRKRLSASRHGEWWMPLIANLLLLLDSATTDREGVILIGATNFVENLDEALIRPGRFDKIVEVKPPDAKGLAEIVSFHLDGSMSPADIQPLARTLTGSTGADAAQWAKDARRRARAAGRDVNFDDLVAVVTVGTDFSSEDRRLIAVHEAGHAVVGIVAGRKIEAVSILRNGAIAGSTLMMRGGSSFLVLSAIETEGAVLLGGRAAEIVIFGRASGGAESDLQEATRIVAAAHGSLGLGDDLLHMRPSGKATEILGFDPAFRRLVSEHLGRMMATTLDVVRLNRAAVEALADALVICGYVDGVEAERIVRDAMLKGAVQNGKVSP